jgi:hypothetical protein
MEVWEFCQLDQGYHKLSPGMAEKEVYAIMGEPFSKGSVEPIQARWDGKQTGDSSGPVVVVFCYAVVFGLKQWCLAFDKDGKLVSRWEPCSLN